MYLSPEGSSSYEGNLSGIELLENEINKLKIQFNDDIYFLISGDVNACVGNMKDYIANDSIQHIFPDDFDWYEESNFIIPRCSMDQEINNHGRDLILLCKLFNIHILNGRFPGDKDGSFTYLHTCGKSLIDYGLLTEGFFKNIKDFEVISRTESPHLPTKIEITTDNHLMNANKSSSVKCQNRTVFYWKQNKAQDFSNKLNDENAQTSVEDIYYQLSKDNINGAVSGLTNLYSYAASSMKGNNVKSEEKKHCKYWDTECDRLKKNKLRALNYFRKTKRDRDLQVYIAAKRSYNLLLLAKENKYQQKLKQQLYEGMHNEKTCWNTVKRLKGAKSNNNTIKLDEWSNYFSNLLNVKPCVNEDQMILIKEYFNGHDIHCDYCIENKPEELNARFTIDEINHVIKRLPNRKAPGPDGLCSEMFKNSTLLCVPIFTLLFNQILDSACFPEEWSKALILPIHKKGSYNNPDNYRGISLLSILSKIFTKCLNNRLVNWAEINNKMYEEQAGFRKGKSTIDQVFILQCLVQKYLSKKKGRFYCICRFC